MVAIPSWQKSPTKVINIKPTEINRNPDQVFAWPNPNLPKSALFGTDGIRGKVGDLLTAPLALQIGYWAGQILQQAASDDHSYNIGPVILGQDSRNSGDMLAMALSAGLTAAGLDVWHLGICPTPCVAYLTSVSSAIGGVMISASHNPPEDNGIKLFGASGQKLASKWQSAIESGIRGNADFTIVPSSCGQHYYRPELLADYTESLYSPLLPTVDLKGMKIVLDLAWGAAVHLAPEVFQAMGAELICLHELPDGDRINVHCGSTHLEALQEAVIALDADLGFGFDGDADRVLGVDHTGRVVDGDYILYLWGRHLQKIGQLPRNLIVTTVMANLGFERAWQDHGGMITRTAVGDQYVQAEMQRTGAMLGGEQSGHILCPHYSVSGDGLLTALHLAAIVRRAGVPLAELIDQSFQVYPQILKNVRVEDREKRLNWQQCETLTRAIDAAEKDLADRGRILVRASGTEPLIRVMVEAFSQELAIFWADNLVKIVEQYL